MTQARTVVGVGASAGGLEALERLLQGTRADGRTAYVVVTHLSPDFKSLLDELLTRHTEMPVRVVEDGVRLEADAVYVIPPNTEMIVMGDRLYLSDRSTAQTMPINVFLSSLAREYGPHSIAVILSGSGSDGAKGAEEVRAAGGLTIVQDPDTARFDSMPRAAIIRCVTARVARPEKIGAIIAGRVGGVEPGADAGTDDENADEVPLDQRAETLSRILHLIYGVSAVDFSLYKLKTVYRRVRRRMTANRHDTLEAYMAQLETDRRELSVLADDMLITVTEFFRDREAFEFLERNVVPDLVRNSSPANPIRLWIAACSSGQEAYSLAILLYRESLRQGVRIDPQIYATDLREASVHRAGAGIFAARDIEALPEDIREGCFEPMPEGEYRIIQPIRRWMVFAEHNILRDPPFTRLDFVSCRNLLIYFEPEAQAKVLSLLNFGLKEQGILFLGRSESLGDMKEDFETISQPWRVFRKIGASTAIRLSLGARLAAIEGSKGERRGVGVGSVPVMAGKTRLGPAYAALIETFIPQGALVTGNREVLHLFGDADAFLRAPKGVMDTDIVKMAPAALRVPLAAALDRAASESREIVFPRLQGPFDDGTEELTLRIVPLPTAISPEARYFFIGLEREETPAPVATVLSADAPMLFDASGLESERISSLERELQVTRENLQATIEEVETSNEELQSTNEELMASNEELQSTNEELQSVNEELYTVNAEYQKKNDELEDVTRDIDNLIASTAIGVIFVDEDLRMRRFTDATARVLNVAPIDIGRSVADITHRLVNVDFVPLIRKALKERRIQIVEAVDRDGDWWQVRVIPLAARWGDDDGAVVTFYEISDLRAAQISAESRADDLRLIAEMTGAHVIHQQPDGSFAGAEPGWTELSGQRDEATVGFGWLDAVHPEGHERLRSFWADAVPEEDEILRTSLRLRGAKDGAYRHIAVLSSPDFDGAGRHAGWTSVAIDVEDTVQSEHIVRDSERMLDTVLRITPARISYVDDQKRYRYVNEAYEQSFDIAREDIIGSRVIDILPESMHAAALSNIDRALAGERTEFTLHGVSPDGGPEILHVDYEPDIQPDGKVAGFAVITRDITRAYAELDDRTRQQARVADLLARSSLAVLVMPDLHARIASASDGATRMTGYSVFDLRQKTLSDLLPEYDARRLDAIVARQERTADQPEVARTFLIDRAGDSIDIELEVVARRDMDPAPVIVFLRDRTASRGTEVALRRRTEELSRSNRMLEVFAAAATHELTSPLRRVAKFSALLKSDHSEALPAEAMTFLDTVVDETDRMRRTIGAVIELVRLERIEIDPAPVDLARLIAGVREGLGETAGAARIEVGSLPGVSGDPAQLEILFRNLLENAVVHAHPDREPRIHIEGEDAGGGMARVRVADNGNGVPEGKRSEIFLPFVRGEGVRDSTGMGLALCRRIAEVHGGALELERSGPDGSTFVVRLPTS